jgi:hypothetical protein
MTGQKARAKAIKASDPLSSINIMKSLRTKSNSSSGSSNGGNNSDNSALVSFGHASFGFNFDSEEGMSNSTPPNSERNEASSDSDGNGPMDSKPLAVTSNPEDSKHKPKQQKTKHSSSGHKSSIVSCSSGSNSGASSEHLQAAADAAANLQTLAETYLRPNGGLPRKRKASSRSDDNDSGGYNTDDDEKNQLKHNHGSIRSGDSMGGDDSTSQPNGKKVNNEVKREERNAREKERSFRISKQINELRDLLSGGGVIVPKGTKSSVLTEAANYIRMLQQHQYRSEM